MSKRKTDKSIRAWGIFIEDTLNVHHDHDWNCGLWSVFLTKTEASRHGEDIRPVEIIIKPKKRKP